MTAEVRAGSRLAVGRTPHGLGCSAQMNRRTLERSRQRYREAQFPYISVRVWRFQVGE